MTSESRNESNDTENLAAEEITNVGPLHRRRRQNFRETVAIYNCRNCNRRYTCRGNLNRHIRLKH